MTCIAGIEDHGTVWIGGDSAGVAGYSISIRADEKVFTNGPFLFGFTTSFRMGQLLRFSFNPPKQGKGVDDYRFMVTDFIDEVRRCLKDGGYAEKDKDQESGGSFLVGYKGKLYEIHSDYQVGINRDGYAAVGCGEDFALGSMFTTEVDGTATAEDRIREALQAAAHHSAGVAGPFTILNI